MNKYVFLDLDGTLVKKDTLSLFISFLASRCPCFLKFVIFVFLPALVCAAIPMLRGKYKNCMARYFRGMHSRQTTGNAKLFYEKRILKHLNKDVLHLVEKLKIQGYKIVLATASIDYYAQYIAQHHSYEHCIATELQIMNNLYTGRLSTPNCKGKEKLHRVDDFLGDQQCHTIAITDHHDDLPLIKRCDKVYAVNPTAKLSKHLLGQKQINFEILN